MADSKKTTVSRPKIRIGKKTNIAIETVPVVPEAAPVVPEPVVPEAAPASIKKTTVKPSAKQSKAPSVAAPSAAEPSVAEPSKAAPNAAASVAEPSKAAPSAAPNAAAPNAAAPNAAAPNAAASKAETRRGEPSRRPDTAKKHGERDLHELYNLYLQNVTKVSPDEELELEVKFGTLGVKSITRINYDTIMKKLLSSGFYVDSTVYLLRIQNEYMEPRTGAPRLSNLRTEISGLQNIRKYCQSNTLDAIDTGISYIDKSRFKTEKPTSVDVMDYNFRISLSKEIRLDKNAQLVRGNKINSILEKHFICLTNKK